MQLSRALGQFFTPPEVVDLAFAVLGWLEPQLAQGTLLDLSCGEGAFLAGALRAGFAPDRLYGLDADERLLTGWTDRFPQAHLALADGLIGGGEADFDVVVGNPPFGGTGEVGHDDYLQAHYHWWRLGVRRKAVLPRELWFLERSLRLLRPGGMLGMVLPEGFLANRRWRAQREALISSCQVEAIIGLPRNVFSGGGAAVKTALLLLRKSRPVAAHQVRLVELAAGELPGSAQTLINEWQKGRPRFHERPWE
jgi:type I restriction-modification system DNA methylase subunit